MNFFIPIILKL